MDKEADAVGQSNTKTDQTLSTGQEAFLERMKNIYEKLQTNGSSLRDLYDEGKTDQLDDQINEMATDLLRDDNEFLTNMSSLRGLRSSRMKDASAEKTLVERNKELLKTYRDLVVMESGLPDEARLNEIETAKKSVADLLSSRGYQGGDPAEALQLLGIVSENDEGMVYAFPETLVPDSVNEKWCIYLTSVIEHVNSEKALHNGTGSQEGVVEADRVRTYAHNAVTGDVHNILGLQGDKGWEFKDTRQLLAHIRDFVLPDDASLTGEAAAQFCKEYHRGFMVSAALSTKR
jgi:hypothetical protein